MFDYLAAGKVIISSKLEGICEILNHRKKMLLLRKMMPLRLGQILLKF